MNLIAAVDKRWAIGNKGQLLVSIPGDQKLFREETLGKVVVMGRKTLESLPGGRPLYGRTTIVLSRDKSYQVKDAQVVHTLEEALRELEKYPSEDIFVAGGQEIYQQFLPYCQTAHITWIDYTYDADTYFPNLDEDEEWELAAESEEQTYFNICYEFRMYKRKK
ncbi:MAG: dihydrofolate reductase [Lachnospiraceae bacterium]|nr:dihydrofolate reductase [Lachnospiraceae bacterium]